MNTAEKPLKQHGDKCVDKKPDESKATQQEYLYICLLTHAANLVTKDTLAIATRHSIKSHPKLEKLVLTLMSQNYGARVKVKKAYTQVFACQAFNTRMCTSESKLLVHINVA